MDDPRQYIRIAAEIRDQIAAGTLAPGCRVPTVTALAEGHGVARQTAGMAMKLLEDEGLIWRVLGHGYYVTCQQAEDPAGRTWQCSCGTRFGDITALEDHLFVFPEEDEHYELVQDWHRTGHSGSLAAQPQ